MSIDVEARPLSVDEEKNMRRWASSSRPTKYPVRELARDTARLFATLDVTRHLLAEAVAARLDPAEDAGRDYDEFLTERGMPAEDEGRLREWLDKREAVPWSRGFSDEFKRGYEAAFEEFRAALAATPEPQ